MPELNENIAKISPDPVRSWIKTLKDLGAVNMFTIGEPDPISKDILEVYAKAAYNDDVSGKTSYPPVAGEEALIKNIVRMESGFNTNLSEEDAKRIYVTIGASQALQFMFSAFKQGSEILVMTPCWGTIYNMIQHSGNVGVPVKFFEDGKFIKENADKALSKKTQAAYINFPSNPTGEIMPEKAIKEFGGWCAQHGIQIITDEPYKYLIHDTRKTPYYSPANMDADVNNKVTVISSFSKIIKPDIRLGYVRLAPEIMQADKKGMILYYFRNLSAGAARGVQTGVNAVLEKDIKLEFLKPLVKNYAEKSELLQKYFREMGCEIKNKPAGSYLMFPKTPKGADGEEYVKRIARDYKTAFLPGSSFGGNMKGFEEYAKNFRVGYGGGLTQEKITSVMDSLPKRNI
ncbi:MAG: pyridoxal phosphate-dependent aminotransferase [Candidatus Altiarchaeota archaeon]|nr:pyridoxal phosphate-dependent aminotransferase [Candidatus Altiarchaeota archaeon]